MPRVNQTLNRRVPLRDAHFDERVSSVFFTTDKSRDNFQWTSRTFIEATRILKEKRSEREREREREREINPSPCQPRDTLRRPLTVRMGRQVEKAKSTGATMNARHLSRGIGVTVKYRAVRPAQRKGGKGRWADSARCAQRLNVARRSFSLRCANRDSGSEERDRRDRGGGGADEWQMVIGPRGLIDG